MDTRIKVIRIGYIAIAGICIALVIGFAWVVLRTASETVGALNDDERDLWIAFHPTVVDARKGIHDFPNDPRAFSQLGFAYYDANQFEAAITQFRTSLQMANKKLIDSESCHLYLARSFAKLNRLDEARTEFLLVLRERPYSVFGKYNGPSREAMEWLIKTPHSYAKSKHPPDPFNHKLK